MVGWMGVSSISMSMSIDIVGTGYIGYTVIINKVEPSRPEQNKAINLFCLRYTYVQTNKKERNSPPSQL